MKQRYLVRGDDVQPYRPAKHTGTVNRRLIGPGVTGGSTIELIHGTLQPQHGAEPHLHEGIQQVCYLLSGRARVVVADETFEMGPGDACLLPADVLHSFMAIGNGPAEVLVIYSPPYGEAV